VGEQLPVVDLIDVVECDCDGARRKTELLELLVLLLPPFLDVVDVDNEGITQHHDNDEEDEERDNDDDGCGGSNSVLVAAYDDDDDDDNDSCVCCLNE
jgi:hypothetical protein